MAKKKSATVSVLDDLGIGPNSKTTKWTLKDTAQTAACAAYVGWFFADYLPGMKKKTATVQWKKPFVFRDAADFPHHTSDRHLSNPELVSQVQAIVADKFSMAGLTAGKIDVTLAPRVTHIKVGINASDAGKNVVKLVTPYLKHAFNREDIVVKQSGANVLIDWPRKNYTALVGDFFLDPQFYSTSKTTVAIGCGTNGNVFYDIAKMPHMLIAGTTGSGKSVFMQQLIMSLLMKNTPEDIELYMIDPKETEYRWYGALSYCHVVQSSTDAISMLSGLVSDMLTRNKIMSAACVRDIDEYNAKNPNNRMKRKVLFIDELSQLMSDKQNRKQAESLIVQLAQLARAAGIHVIIATQRPTVNVVTGLIKANIECRVALKVNSRTDSMVILDQIGAEKLTGHGDLLFLNGKDIEPVRLQGGLIETDSIICTISELLENRVGYEKSTPTNHSSAEQTAQNAPYQTTPTRKAVRTPKKRNIFRKALLATIAIPFLFGAVSEAHEAIRKSVVAEAEETMVETETPQPGTWSNAETWSESDYVEYMPDMSFTERPSVYDEPRVEHESEYEGYTQSYFANEEAEQAWQEGRPYKQEEEGEVVTYTPLPGVYTISAEPLDGSIDEYTISDAYVKPRIRTRDRTFVSHIDELHFPDD